MRKPPPRLLTKEEWGMLFIRWLVTRKSIKSRYRELEVEELDKLSKRFAARWWSMSGLKVSAAQIIDTCMNEGWFVPAAGSTFTLRDDLVRNHD